jgi:hypothetical protein
LRQKEKRKSGKIQFMVIAGNWWQNVQIAKQSAMNGDQKDLLVKKREIIVLVEPVQFVLGVTK